MAEFFVSVSEQSMAEQIAGMVNSYNQWYTRFSARALLLMQGRYFVELVGDKVVACAGVVREYPTLSKIMHVCVLPEYRKRKLASKLVNMAAVNCGTDQVYMTIRADNTASLKMAESLGFVYVRKDWFRDHFTFTLGRRSKQWPSPRKTARPQTLTTSISN